MPRSRPGAELLPLDFAADDVPDKGCVHCPGWWCEQTQDADGTRVTREWHQPTCPDYLSWCVPLRSDGDLQAALVDLVDAAEHLTYDQVSTPTRSLRRPSDLTLSDLLADVSSVDGRDDTVDQILGRVWSAVSELMNLDLYLLHDHDSRSGDLSLTTSAGLGRRISDDLLRLRDGDAVLHAVAHDRAMRAYSHLGTHPDTRLDAIKATGADSFASFPLLRDGSLIGTWSVGSMTRPTITDHELLLLRACAELLAGALAANDPAEQTPSDAAGADAG